ncbi:nucleolar protein 10-like isoform X2 [Dysidea avara]
MPKAGRDMAYHYSQCDLYLAGTSPEVYRLNLEQGKFLSSLKTQSNSCNVLELNDHHHLLAVGTTDGRVECWDPRSPKRAGQFSLSALSMDFLEDVGELPGITALSFRDTLNLAVGTATGQVLLYDIRSSQPYAVRDHNSGRPVRSIAFQDELDLVLSADTKLLKIWHRKDCAPYAAIEPESDINQMTYIKDTGLIFMATEAPEMLSYYIPSLGPAPRWCSFLDNLLEELEENNVTVYDDYKFVTAKELESLGLTNLLGTNLLRAYMHGYFMDMKLYHKVKAIVEPFAYEEYRKNKIREKIEEQRATRIRRKKLPKVNKQLAEKLLDGEEKEPTENPLGDDRFKEMFTNPDFQIDEESEEYKLLYPTLAKKAQRKEKEKQLLMDEFEEINDVGEEEIEGKASSDESSSSSDDGHTFSQRNTSRVQTAQPKLYQLKRGATYHPPNSSQAASLKSSRYTFGQLLEQQESQQDSSTTVRGTVYGSKEIAFKLSSGDDDRRKKQQLEHKTERKKLRRSAHKILPKHKRKLLKKK